MHERERQQGTVTGVPTGMLAISEQYAVLSGPIHFAAVDRHRRRNARHGTRMPCSGRNRYCVFSTTVFTVLSLYARLMLVHN